MLTEDSVLETLRRVNGRIILAVMGRDIELGDGATCLCGWLIREKLAEIRNVGASTVDIVRPFNAPWAGSGCAKLYGGTTDEWNAIYYGVTMFDELPIIESAWAQRVDEAVFGRRTRKAVSRG